MTDARPPIRSKFEPLADVAGLDALFERPETAVVFLHDPYCPISADAAVEMAEVGGPIALIDVSRQKDLSRRIAEKTGVRHESPQTFVIRDGAVAWHASHYRIEASRVREAMG